jgi:diaminopropionate ammonia-lyase
MRLLTATAGNHGRAVARAGRWLGLDSVVALPTETSNATVDAIVAEGAEVRLVNSSYDAAVEIVRQLANKDQRFVLVQDTAWSGYEQVPPVYRRGLRHVV